MDRLKSIDADIFAILNEDDTDDEGKSHRTCSTLFDWPVYLNLHPFVYTCSRHCIVNCFCSYSY
jgi:hypothetical protein